MEARAAQLPAGSPADEPPPSNGPLRRFAYRAGDMVLFWLHAAVELRGVWRYTGEVLRQAAILATGTTLFLAALMMVHGSLCSVFGTYFLRGAGAADYLGLFTSQCSIRGGIPLMFGYVFAAKIGCGLAAEIGAMRISEELDAYDSVGVDPMRFVVGTRIVAAVIFIPIAFGIAAGAHALGTFIGALGLLGDISQGGFERVHWGLQSLEDQLICLVIVGTIGTLIVIVATYFGYRVRGGPASVGRAVAASMVVNLVLVHVVYGALAAAFWGDDINLPIGG